jgi:hypothetical protein
VIRVSISVENDSRDAAFFRSPREFLAQSACGIATGALNLQFSSKRRRAAQNDATVVIDEMRLDAPAASADDQPGSFGRASDASSSAPALHPADSCIAHGTDFLLTDRQEVSDYLAAGALCRDSICAVQIDTT